jgi:hypothetical protein
MSQKLGKKGPKDRTDMPKKRKVLRREIARKGDAIFY